MAGQRCMALPSAICHHQQHRHQAGAHYADSTANSWLAQAAQSSIGSTLAALPARKDWRAAEQPSSRAATKQLSIGAAAARRKSSHRRGEIDGDAVAGRPRLQTMGKQMGKQSGAALGPSLSPPRCSFSVRIAALLHVSASKRKNIQPKSTESTDATGRPTHTHTERAWLPCPIDRALENFRPPASRIDAQLPCSLDRPRQACGPANVNSPAAILQLALEPRASSLELGARVSIDAR